MVKTAISIPVPRSRERGSMIMNAEPSTSHPHQEPLAALLLLGLVLGALPADAALRAWLDRDQVYAGDSVTLTIQAEGANHPGQPDLGVLAADFDVLGSSRGSAIRIINGQHSANTNWRISLSPKHAGQLRIPPIPVGAETTETLTLRVAERPDSAQGGPGDDVFVELELGVPQDQVVVQQQVPISVRLFSARNLISGGLSEPRADGAVLERLGEDRRYRTSRNGREYQVIERRYSLSPEYSGELRIPPVVFEGEIEIDSGADGAMRRRNSLFDDPMFDRMFDDSLLRRGFSMFERGKPVRAQSEALTIDVAASPDGFAGGPWLPAEDLTVADDWASDPPRLRVGEPATRTLTLTAKGLSGSQIPAIEMPVPDGLRRYPEPPESESRTDGATLFGVSRQSYTLIPTRAGPLTLPGIDVSWWDTDVQRERIARVPALTLEVVGGATAAGQSFTVDADSRPDNAPADEPEPGVDSGAPTVAEARTPSEIAQTPASSTSGRQPWVLIGAALFAILAAAGATAWRWTRRRAQAPRPTPPAQPNQPSARALREPLRQACLADNPLATAKALLAWARARWPTHAPANLAEIARRLPAAEGPIRALEQTLYAPEGGGWSGIPLWQAFVKAEDSNKRERNTDKDALEPLYPHPLS